MGSHTSFLSLKAPNLCGWCSGNSLHLVCTGGAPSGDISAPPANAAVLSLSTSFGPFHFYTGISGCGFRVVEPVLLVVKCVELLFGM